MSVYFLIIIYAINLLWAYRHFKCYIAPPILFGVGFLAMAVTASFYIEEWGLSLRNDTFFILSFGVLWFTFVCIVVDKCLHKKRQIPQQLSSPSFKNINVKRLKKIVLFFVIIGVIACFFKLMYLRRYYGGYGSLSAMLYGLRADIMDDDIAFNFPIWLRISLLLTNSFVNVSIFCLCFQWILKYKDDLLTFLLIAQISTYIILVLSNGARGGLVIIAMAIVIIYLIKQIHYLGKIVISNKVKIVAIITLSFTATAFYSLGTLLGREPSYDSTYGFAVYCGAQIKNLDLFMDSPLRSNEFGSNQIWGRETFFVLNKELSKYLNDEKLYARRFDLPWLSYKGLSLGNVYTTFYQFYYDFEYTGVIILTALMAFISILTYRKSINMNQSFFELSLYMVCYARIGYCLLLSFFSNKFYEEFFTIGFLKILLLMYIYKILFDKYILYKKRY